MIYVMECGPVIHRGRDKWLCFSLNLNDRQAKVRAMERRQDARLAVASELPDGVPVSCCASLGKFGRSRGWRVRSVPDEVLTLAAETLVGMENQEALGMLAFTPTADAWLRTSALFLRAEPWRMLSMKKPLSITFTKKGGTSTTRVAAVGGASVMPPSLLLLPDQAAWERLNMDDGVPGLDDALLSGFDAHTGALSEAIGLAYGVSFHPIVLRLRGRKPVPMTEPELLELAAALGAVASLCERPVGRAMVDDLEAIAMPLIPESSLRC